MSELPRGTVTFLFTDVEGSTRILLEHPDDYAGHLSEHRRKLRDAFERHGGVEVDTQGDALFVAFSRASDAVAAAEDAQRALQDSPLRVRIGLHTGEPFVAAEGYVGMDVHRAARIAAAGSGGQVLVSQATRDLAGRTDLRDLGEHRLKDLPTPVRIYQLGEGEFPPLRTLYAVNLPVAATPFIGRKSELAEATALISRDGVRMVTLTGAGGSGKTRLALEVAAAVADQYEHGVWWVPLSPVMTAEDVVPAIGRVLGMASPVEMLGDRRALLLLDNFEHVIAAASDLATLLRTCPRVEALVTSRERLAVAGEHVYPVPVLSREEAQELFLARARAASPGFEPGARLAELCSRLDDLPLAIELAASRASLLSVDELLQRLGSRLDLLRGGRDAEVRHRTLRATIEWSYELMTPDERRLLAALSVFRGGWSLETAERVAGATLERLQSLLDKSLVRRLEAGRFTMLDTLRDFAAERLEPHDRDEILKRLLDFELELFNDANLSEEARGRPRTDLAHAERPNLDVALAWAGESGHAVPGLELLYLTEMYWITNDPVEGRKRVDTLAAIAGANLEPGLKARALRFRGAAFDLNNRYELSEPEYRGALEIFQGLGEEGESAHMRNRIAYSVFRQGDIDRAVLLATESLESARRRGDAANEGFALYVLAMAAFEHGDPAKGMQMADTSVRLSREVGFLWFSGATLLGTAEHLITAGLLDEAESRWLASVETIVSVSDHVNMPYAFAAGAAIAVQRHDALRAGMLWGALEAIAELEPRTTTRDAIREYGPRIEAIQGPEFEAGRARGRELPLEDALLYARSGIATEGRDQDQNGMADA